MGQHKSERLTSVLHAARSLAAGTCGSRAGKELCKGTRGDSGCQGEPLEFADVRGMWKFASGETRSHVVLCNYSAVSRMERPGICREYSSALA